MLCAASCWTCRARSVPKPSIDDHMALWRMGTLGPGRIVLWPRAHCPHVRSWLAESVVSLRCARGDDPFAQALRFDQRLGGRRPPRRIESGDPVDVVLHVERE